MLVSRATGTYSTAPMAVRAAASVSPTAWCLGTITPWTPNAVGGPQQRPEVPGVLDLVEGEEERGLSPLGGDREQVLQVDVLRGGHPGHDPLVLRRCRRSR